MYVLLQTSNPDGGQGASLAVRDVVTKTLESGKPPEPGNSLVDRLYAPIPVRDLPSDSDRKQPTIDTVPNNVRRTAKVV